MKIRLRLGLAGLAIGFALPSFAQQKDAARSRVDEGRSLFLSSVRQRI